MQSHVDTLTRLQRMKEISLSHQRGSRYSTASDETTVLYCSKCDSAARVQTSFCLSLQFITVERALVCHLYGVKSFRFCINLQKYTTVFGKLIK